MERLWAVQEVATWLQVRRARVYELAASRRIPSLKVGRHLRFDPEVLNRWKNAGCPSEQSPTRGTDKP